MSGPLAVMDVATDRLTRAACHVPNDSRMATAQAAADLEVARAAVVELVAADNEYESARRDWDYFTALEPGDFTTEEWERVANNFEEAVARRAAALAKFKEE